MGCIFWNKKKRPRSEFDGVSDLSRFGIFDRRSPDDNIELFMAGSDRSTALFGRETDWYDYEVDSNCIVWVFEMSIDSDVIMAIMRFIPEAVWYAGIRTTPSEWLYDMVLEWFDRSSGGPAVIPKLRNKAYLNAKALLHLAIQRKCIGDESDRTVFKSISGQHPIIGSRHYEGDSDLEVTLGIINPVFGYSQPMRW